MARPDDQRGDGDDGTPSARGAGDTETVSPRHSTSEERGAQAEPTPFAHNVLPSHHNSLRRSSSRLSRQSRNERRASSGPVVDYDVPDSYANLDEVYAQPPVQNPDEEPIRHVATREEEYPQTGEGPGPEGESLGRQRTRRESQASAASREARMLRRRSTALPVDYDVPEAYANLDELAVSPIQNPDESPIYRYHSLEEARTRDQEAIKEKQARRRESLTGAVSRRPSRAGAEAPPEAAEPAEKQPRFRVSRFATQLYTISYLVFFSIMGTLARLGLQALTSYPGAPVTFSSLWANFGGSLFMGFLAEDRMLFRFEWGTPTYENQLRLARELKARDEESGSGSGSGSGGSDQPSVDLAAARKAYMATKKTIPLYIGLATGFCGSFTSFSSFIRDSFLAVANSLPTPGVADIAARNGGYSFMALLAVVIVTVSLSLSGLFIGAHLAITLEPITPSVPYAFMRKFLDQFMILLGWGCWLGAVFLSIWPPDRHSDSPEHWRGRATFALVFAPLGCLARFYASLYLNGLAASFPVGTFAVNVFGTGVLGMSWDLAHVPLGGVVGCQVLQGIEDGFCGCLTTVSTWVAELASLRRRHAYFYGGTSVVVAFAVLVAVMGGLRWSRDFAVLQCTH